MDNCALAKDANFRLEPLMLMDFIEARSNNEHYISTIFP